VEGKKVLENTLLKGKNIHVKFNTCGRENCACKLGQRHGPYYYVRQKVDGKYRDVYVKPPSESFVPFTYNIVGSDIVANIKTVDEIPESFSQCMVFKISNRLK
jgi:hypothetical protein